PLLRGRDDLPLPDVLAQDEEEVPRLVLVGEVEVRLAALEVETLHAGVEVDQADGDAGEADDGQAGPVALALDKAALLRAQVERVGEDVDGVEADLLGHADAERGVAAGLRPRRVNQSELHGRGPRGTLLVVTRSRQITRARTDKQPAPSASEPRRSDL